MLAEDWLGAEAEGFPGLLGKGLRNPSVREGACLGERGPSQPSAELPCELARGGPH